MPPKDLGLSTWKSKGRSLRGEDRGGAGLEKEDLELVGT